jgi:hypothetical protein
LQEEKLCIAEVRKNRLGPQIANPQVAAFVEVLEDPPIEQICGFSYKNRAESLSFVKKLKSYLKIRSSSEKCFADILSDSQKVPFFGKFFNCGLQ